MAIYGLITSFAAIANSMPFRKKTTFVMALGVFCKELR